MDKNDKYREKLQEEIDAIVAEAIQNEGIMDFLRTAAQGAKQAVSGAWQKVSGGMTRAVQQLQKTIQNKLAQIQQVQGSIGEIVGTVQQAEQATGEKIPANEAFNQAQSVSKEIQAALGEVQQAEAQVKQQKPAAAPQPQQQAPQPVQEMVAVLEETVIRTENHQKKVLSENVELMSEDLGLTTVLGLALGLMGGLPMMFKGLTWVANKLKLPKVAAAMQHAHEVVHHFEEKVIDFIIPDRLSFVIYQSFWKKGLKASTRALSYQEYAAGKENARKKVETYVYKAFLVYFFLNGLAGVLHSASALLRVAEASATLVKGVELAGATAEIAGSMAGIGQKA